MIACGAAAEVAALLARGLSPTLPVMRAIGVPELAAYVRDVAHVQLGPELRRGAVELDGEGEVAGGVVILRYGGDALENIEEGRDKQIGRASCRERLCQ